MNSSDSINNKAPNIFALVLQDGDVSDAEKYIAQRFPGIKYHILTKSGLGNKSVSEIIKSIRIGSLDEAFVFSNDLDFQTKIFFLSVVLIITGAKRLFFADSKGRTLRITRASFIFWQIPCFIFEAVIFLMSSGFLLIAAFLLKAFFKSGNKKSKGAVRKPDSKDASVKKVLFLRTEFAFQIAGGGSVTHINGIAKGFEDNGCKISFVSNERMKSIDYPTRVIPPSTFFSNFPDCQLIYNFRFFFRALRYIRELRPDILYLRHDFYTLSGLLLSKYFNIPLVLENNGVRLWERSYWDTVYMTPIVRLIEDAVMLGCKQIVVVTDTIKEECVALGIPEEKILVTPNAVDPEMFYPGAGGDITRQELGIETGKIVAYSGSFINFHGMDVLQKAIPSICAARDDVSFLLIGDGPMKPAVEAFIKKNKWEKRIILTGCIPLADVPRYLDAADILLAPYVPLGGGSKFFGSSVKQFEYMAMEKGIVASDIGQIGKLLKHEHSALLVKPGDSDELAAAVIRLLEDGDLCRRIAINARKDVLSKHTWQKNVDDILKHHLASS